MDLSKVKTPMVYFVVGVLVTAPVFYALGYSIAEAGMKRSVESLQTKYDLAKKALEAEIAKNRDLESRVVHLETTVRNLSRILDTVYDAVRDVKVSGQYDGIDVEAQALYIVGSRFCIEITMKNTTDLQKTFTLGISGQGVEGDQRETTLYAGERRKVDVCGTLKDIAAEAIIVMDGNPVVRTVLVAE